VVHIAAGAIGFSVLKNSLDGSWARLDSYYASVGPVSSLSAKLKNAWNYTPLPYTLYAVMLNYA
jgi:hypothetical protein